MFQRKGSKSQERTGPPPPPPPLRAVKSSNDNPPTDNPSSPNDVVLISKPHSLNQPIIPHDLDITEIKEEQENVVQEMNELFRGIQDLKQSGAKLNVDIGGENLRRSVDSNMEPIVGVESPASAAQRNSDPEDLPDPDAVNSPPMRLEDDELDEDDDDDDVEELEDVDDVTNTGIYCNQMFIRELLQQEGILKPYGIRPPVCKPSPLSVDTGIEIPRPPQRSDASDKIETPDGNQPSTCSSSQPPNVSSSSPQTGSKTDANDDYEVISDQDESNSTDTTASTSSSNQSFPASSHFVKPGNSLIWDLLVSNNLAQLAPEQQEYVKQNLFDLIGVFLKYPEVLKEMVKSLLTSVSNNCSTITCVKLLQALFSSVLSLSNYAIQTHSMLDVLVNTIANLAQSGESVAFEPLDNRLDEENNGNTLLSDGSFLSQSDMGEFLHLFEAVFHKSNHCACYTFSDEHVMTLWSILSANPNYKDFFLNWLCGICQTDEVQVMTEQQWLMIYCKLVMTDAQYSKLQSDAAANAQEWPVQTNADLRVVTSFSQGTCPVLADSTEVQLLAVLFCKAVKGVFLGEQESSSHSDKSRSSHDVDVLARAESSSSNVANAADDSALVDIKNELVSAGLRQFWTILVKSKDSEMQKMARDVLSGYYLHLPELAKEQEFVTVTFDRVSKFLESTEAVSHARSFVASVALLMSNLLQLCLRNLKELQSIVCLLRHHIQQSYKKYSFHIRYSALKHGTAPLHSHSKTWMPRKGSHSLKLYLSNRGTGVNQPKMINMQSSDYLGELRAEITFFQSEEVRRQQSEDSTDANVPESSRLRYYRMLTNGLELKLEHDDRTLSDLCMRDEAQVASVLTYLPVDDSNETSSAKFQLGDVLLKFPGCLYVEPPMENYPQVILLRETHFNKLFELLRQLSYLKTGASKVSINRLVVVASTDLRK